MMKYVAIKPPMKNAIVAMNDVLESCDIPIMQCPAVHPFDQRAPKPINIPPKKKIAQFLRL